MMSIERDEIISYVENNIGDFHKRRLNNLEKLKLDKILKRKNPYLFKAKNTLLSQDLVKSLLDAHLSSQEEAIFGEFLEGLAIHICGKAYSGEKSSTEGIDLNFEKDGIHYIVSIKSGPNWGNASQIKKMKEYFRKAEKTLHTSNSKINVRAINGCCYGRDDHPEKDGYLKLCGERFWEFISGDENLYIDIIDPLGHKAKEKNQEFQEAYSKIVNNFTQEFTIDFCCDGEIDWEKLVKFNSSKTKIMLHPKSTTKARKNRTVEEK